MQKSLDAAVKIADDGYVVYVASNKDVQDAARKKIITQNCRRNAKGIVVNGKTKFVSVDFSEIWPLLPKNLRQPAKTGPFICKPAAASDAIDLVNGIGCRLRTSISGRPPRPPFLCRSNARHGCYGI